MQGSNSEIGSSLLDGYLLPRFHWMQDVILHQSSTFLKLLESHAFCHFLIGHHVGLNKACRFLWQVYCWRMIFVLDMSNVVRVIAVRMCQEDNFRLPPLYKCPTVEEPLELWYSETCGFTGTAPTDDGQRLFRGPHRDLRGPRQHQGRTCTRRVSSYARV